MIDESQFTIDELRMLLDGTMVYYKAVMRATANNGSDLPVIDALQHKIEKMLAGDKTKKLISSSLWQLAGYDVFSSEDYNLDGEYTTQELAETAARNRLAELEVRQPSASSNGQGSFGIQDRVYVIRPDGTRYRFTSKLA
jgi:hypothetical protein